MSARRAARTALVLAAAALVAPLLAVPASATPGPQPQLAQVRRATAAYHDMAKAEAAGYSPLLACIDSPAGGMGQHLARTADFDADVDALHPEALVYEPATSGYRLVAVEYIVPIAAWIATDPPELFGQRFHRNDVLGIWALHAWIWRPNPSGMFADFNPAVARCS